MSDYHHFHHLDVTTHSLLERMIGHLARLSGDNQASTRLILERLNAMSRETTAELDQLKADIAAEIDAIGPAISLSVAAQLAAAGVDDATVQTTISAIDAAVKTETANLVALAAPTTQPGSVTSTTAPTFAPTSISGPVGTAITGQFTASNGEAFTYASDGAVADVSVGSSGAYSCPATTAETGTLTITPTSSAGVVGTPFSVSVSIA